MEKDFLHNSTIKDKPRTSIRAKLDAAKKKVAKEDKQKKLESPDLEIAKKNKNRIGR